MMRRLLSLVLISSLAVIAAESHANRVTFTPWKMLVAPAETVVTFPDANLETVIRNAIGKPSGDIYDSDLAALTSLDASMSNISDLSGMEHCTQLTELSLRGNNITDIGPISGLLSLTSLRLDTNNLTNAAIQPLANLTNLTVLNIGDHLAITDITPIASLVNLKDLNIAKTRVATLQPLAGLTKLTALDAIATETDSIAPLANLVGLEYLRMHHNPITELSPISNLVNLTFLTIGNNPNTDYTHGELAALAPLRKLQTLRIDRAFLDNASLAHIAVLTSLELLYLTYNNISDISALASLTGLVELHMNNNQIEDITAIASMPEMWRLNMASNIISDITSLGSLANLKFVFLANNQIADIAAFGGNPAIDLYDKIDLTYNCLNLTPGSEALQHIAAMESRGAEVYYDPQILGITSGPTGAPNPVPGGQQVACSVTAVHAGGLALGYQWSAQEVQTTAAPGAVRTTAGSFDDDTAQNPTWTAPANNTTSTAKYKISVVVTSTDNKSLTGSYTQFVDPDLTLLSVEFLSPATIKLNFSVALDPVSAADPGSYMISNDLDVLAASLGGDGKSVTLTTGVQTELVEYTVTADGVQDVHGRVADEQHNSGSWTTPEGPPQVAAALYVDPTHVDVVFSKAVAASQAEMARNYSIQPSLSVSDAVLDQNGITVHLTIATQTENTNYEVTVSNVRDLDGRQITSGYNKASWVSAGVPPFVVNHSPANGTAPVTSSINVAFNEAMNATATAAAFSIDPAAPGVISWSGDGMTLTYTISALLDYTTQYTVTISTGAVDLNGNQMAAPHQWSFTTEALPTFTRNFQAGTWMVGLPALPDNAQPDAIFGTNQVAIWDGGTQAYGYFTQAAFGLGPGQGCWVKYDGPATASFQGYRQFGSVLRDLNNGWNLLANPGTGDLHWSAVGANGTIQGFGWAQKADQSGYELICNIAGLNSKQTVDPWQGFWLRAEQDCQATIGVATVGVQEQDDAVQWAIRLMAQAGSATDTDNYVGVAKTAAALTASNPPPLAGQYVDLYAVDAAGQRNAVSLAGAAGNTQWDMVAETNIPSTQVQITYPDLSSVPSTLSLVLQDLDTGRTMNMRTSQSYSFTTGPSGGKRHLRVEATANEGRTAALTSVTAQATSEGAQITYALSAPAEVEAEVMNIAGRLISRIPCGYQSAGTHTAIWNGRNMAGSKVPSGQYLVLAHSVAQDGTRMTRMLSIRK